MAAFQSPRKRVFLAGILTLVALWILFGSGEGLALRLDSSAAAVTRGDLVEDTDARHDTTELVALITPEILRTNDIRALATLTSNLQRRPDVQSATSAATAQFPQVLSTEDGDDILIGSLVEAIDLPGSDLQAAIDLALAEPGFAGQLLVDQPGSPLAMTLWVRADRATANVPQIADDIRQSAREQGWRVAITGEQLVTDAVGRQIFTGLQRMIVLIGLLVVVVLLVAYRSAYLLFAVGTTMGVALIWTLAGMVVLDIPIHVVTVLVPPFALTLCLAYCMHAVDTMVAHTRPMRQLNKLILPLAVTGVTTVVGLLALGWAAISAIREFAIASSFSVVAALLAVGTVLGPLIAPRAPSLRMTASISNTLQHLADWAARVTNQRRRQIIAAGIALALLAGLAATQTESGASYVRDLPADTPERQDYERIAMAIGGANSFSIELVGNEPNSVLQPNVLSAVDDLDNWLGQQAGVGRVSAPTSIIKRLNQAFTSGGPDAYQLPETLATTRQLLLFGAPSQLRRQLSVAGDRLQIDVYTSLDDTRALRGLLDSVSQKLREMPGNITVQLGGNAVLLTDTVQRLTDGQLRAFLFAFAGIYLVLAAVFASLREGLRAMLPNVLPVLIYFGLIGLFGIPLGPATALVACIVLGVAVDDTLLYLVRFNRAAHAGGNEVRAAESALRAVIRPVTLTTVVVSLGLLSAVSTGFGSHAQFGALAAITLVAAWVSDLLLTPALAAGSTLVTLWDVLRIDLGQAPQKTLPLFSGMSARQARLFALLSHRHTVAGGELFLRVGDPGTEMFLILEGEVKVWVESSDAGEPMEIVRLRRGDTFGETGLFFESRTANVSTTRRTRMLAFSYDDLERVRRRYPRVAALALRNLNRAQAEVVARATQRISTE